MKSKLLLLFACTFLFYRCNDFKSVRQIPKKEVRFIFLFDRIDETATDGFNKVFFKIVDTLEEEITQGLPENISDISFSVYNAANKTATPVVISFSDHDTKETKEEMARQFLSQLVEDTSTRDYSRSNYVLRNLERLLTSMDDSTVVYRVALFSRLIENTGDVMRDSIHEIAAKQGNFHFISGSGVCNKPAIDAAESQLTDSTGWIYRHLVKLVQEKPWLRSIPISIYGSNEPEPRADEHGNDAKSIEAFWDKLFSQMGLSVQRKAHLNLTGYRFFK